MFALLAKAFRVFVRLPVNYLLADRPWSAPENLNYLVLGYHLRPSCFCHTGFFKPGSGMAIWTRHGWNMEPSGRKGEAEIGRAYDSSKSHSGVDFILSADDNHRMWTSRISARFVHLSQNNASNLESWRHVRLGRRLPCFEEVVSEFLKLGEREGLFVQLPPLDILGEPNDVVNYF